MSDVRVLVLVGSLRADSFNRRLALALRDQAPAGVAIEIAEGIERLPFYNEDLDNDAVPEPVTQIRARIAAADRILLVTPEYNGTVPGVLTNVLAWVSRPRGAAPIAGKPLAVVGTSVGRYGGQWAHEDARRVAGVAGAHVVDSIVLNHRASWGQDPAEDAATVRRFSDAVAQLASFQPVAA